MMDRESILDGNLAAGAESLHRDEETKINISQRDGGEQSPPDLVQCLLYCESVIFDLGAQLDVKDRRIAALEERIVEMSLELARAKALEDEHRLLKRRISSVDGDDDEDKQPRELPSLKEPRLVSTTNLVNYAPVSNRPRSKSVALPSKAQQDGTVESGEPDFISWPSQEDHEGTQDTTGDTPGAERHPEPRRRGGFRLSRLTKRMSWGANLDGSNKAVPTTIDVSQRSLGDSARSSLFGSFSCDSKALEQEFPSSGRRKGALGNSNRSLDDSGSRRMSNLGQLLLGLPNKNERSEANHQGVTVGNELSLHRRQASCPVPELSGVVFPVSSGDCLLGLLDNDDRGRKISTANAEWGNV